MDIPTLSAFLGWPDLDRPDLGRPDLGRPDLTWRALLEKRAWRPVQGRESPLVTSISRETLYSGILNHDIYTNVIILKSVKTLMA